MELPKLKFYEIFLKKTSGMDSPSQEMDSSLLTSRISVASSRHSLWKIFNISSLSRMKCQFASLVPEYVLETYIQCFYFPLGLC